ncbi:MAG: Fic family protein, partial [Lachnospiraceae bacterium]|nr:Fic family protein [Lachnospiraceae bacterium]
DIIAFHSDFEHIHPFQDGNERVGRLMLLRNTCGRSALPTTGTWSRTDSNGSTGPCLREKS